MRIQPSRPGDRGRRFSGTAVASLPGTLLLLAVLGCEPKVCPEESFTNSVGMKMVKLSSGYYVSRFETRQVEFEGVMGFNVSKHRDATLPVDNLTGEEAEEVCAKLTDMERVENRLP